MKDDDVLNFLSFPPQFHKPNPQASQETSQSDFLKGSSSEFDKTQDFCVATSQYLEKITTIFLEKMQTYENKNEEIEKIIHKERLLEESVQTLKSIITFLCMIALIMILLFFAIFIIINIPDSNTIKKYLTEHVVIELGAGVYCLYFLIKSYHDLKNLSLKVNNLERKSKLDS